MNETGARRRYREIFDEAVRQKLGLRQRIAHQWEAVCTTDKSVEASWREFAGGSKTQAAVAEVTVDGRTYWAEASVRLDDGDFEWQRYLGLIGIWLMGERVSVVFWEADPRLLPYPISDYWSSQPPEGAPRRVVITNAGDLSYF